MSGRSQNLEFKIQSRVACGITLLVLLASSFAALADDLTSLCANRAAIERVYYNQRRGGKPPFAPTLPPATLEKLVRQDLRKEAALKQAYGVEVRPALLAAEVQRINATTRAPEMLAARPAETNAPAAAEIEIKKHFGPNAQIISSPHTAGKEAKFSFEDLPGELQNVLRVQLRRLGDVSAVIETPGGFLLCMAKEKPDRVLSVAGLSLPKRSYEQWLEEQTKEQP